jgi:hypothetical protein
MTFQEFDSLDDAFEFMRKAEEQANASLHPCQQQITWGDYWMRPYDDLLIFGYINTREENIAGEVKAGADMAELEYTTRTLDSAHARGYRFGTAYSVIEPRGELGSTHVADMCPISKELFETAREQGWQLTRDQYVAAVDAAGLR